MLDIAFSDWKPYLIIPPIYGNMDVSIMPHVWADYPKNMAGNKKYFVYSSQPWYFPWTRYVVDPQGHADNSIAPISGGMLTQGAALGIAEITVLIIILYLIYRMLK